MATVRGRKHDKLVIIHGYSGAIDALTHDMPASVLLLFVHVPDEYGQWYEYE